MQPHCEPCGDRGHQVMLPRHSDLSWVTIHLRAESKFRGPNRKSVPASVHRTERQLHVAEETLGQPGTMRQPTLELGAGGQREMVRSLQPGDQGHLTGTRIMWATEGMQRERGTDTQSLSSSCWSLRLWSPVGSCRPRPGPGSHRGCLPALSRAGAQNGLGAAGR